MFIEINHERCAFLLRIITKIWMKYKEICKKEKGKHLHLHLLRNKWIKTKTIDKLKRVS